MFLSVAEYEPPNYCHQCGHAYLWTEQRLLATQTLIDELEELENVDKKLLKEAITDLSTNNSRTEMAASRYTRIKDKINNTVSASFLDSAVKNIVGKSVEALIGII